MDIQGEKILAMPRHDVWRALNDPSVLQRCLAGCDTFEAETGSDNRYRVALQASVGPVRARFSGKLQLQDRVPATSYALAFEGSGGVAGFGKGTARVTLDDAAEGTRLRYTAQAQVGGRLAQVGARLIDGVTQRMADDFFSRFVKELAAVAPATGHPAAATASIATPPASTPLAREPGVSQPANAAASQASPHATQIAVIAAAVAATAAAVSVLAAVVAIQLAR